MFIRSELYWTEIANWSGKKWLKCQRESFAFIRKLANRVRLFYNKSTTTTITTTATTLNQHIVSKYGFFIVEIPSN